MHAQRPSERRLLIMLALAIGGFIGSTLLSQVAEGNLHGDTRAILDDALPSIEHLAALRTELFREEALARRAAQATEADRAPIDREIKEAQITVRREEAAYEVLPALVGERPLTTDLRALLNETSLALDADLASPGDGKERDARFRRAELLFDRAETSALTLLELEAAKAAAFTRAIETAHARTVVASLVLDALSAIFAIILAMTSWRAVRFYIDQQEERASELDRFAGRVAHDIISPLSAVSMALTLIQRGSPSETLVSRASASLQRVDAIVEALLDFARAGARLEPGARCDVAEVLAGVIEDAAGCASTRGVAISLEAPRDIAVACHAGVLASVAGNLVGNAVKYIGSSASERRVSVRAHARKHSVRVEIEDTGPGIPKDLRLLIFEPFVRGKACNEPGIGLGLATAKRLCEALGGQIGVVSEEGVGSTFWFELPLADPADREAQDPPAAAAVQEGLTLH